MQIVADTNTFLAVTLYEPERDKIIRLDRHMNEIAQILGIHIMEVI